MNKPCLHYSNCQREDRFIKKIRLLVFYHEYQFAAMCKKLLCETFHIKIPFHTFNPISLILGKVHSIAQG